MSIAVNIISAVIKSIVGDQVGNDLANEVIGISVDGLFEKGMDRVGNFIDDEKAKIEHILSKGNMKAMNIPAENIDYVVAEIKDLLSEVEITDEVLRQCKYDSKKLGIFLWDKYCEYNGNGYIECKDSIKKCLFVVAEALINIMCKSEEFEKDFLIQISNSVDNTNMEMQKLSNYIKENFDKFDVNSQVAINMLQRALEHIQDSNIQNKETQKIIKSRTQEYLDKWNKNMFLNDFDKRDKKAKINVKLREIYLEEHLPHYIWGDNNEEEPSTDLKDLLTEYINEKKASNMLLILGQPGIGKSTLITWIINHFSVKISDILVYKFASDLKRVAFWSKNTDVFLDIINRLNLSSDDLEGKILVIDGFDEISVEGDRVEILNHLYNKLVTMERISLIITCRENYIQRVNRLKCKYITLKTWDDKQIISFYTIFQKNTKNSISKNTIKKLIENKEVLGIPLILYMVLALNICIEKEGSMVDVYDRIFSLEGGIYDRCINNKNFSELHRISKIKKQIHQISKEIALWMFENNSRGASIPQKEYIKICSNVVKEQGNENIEQDVLIGNYFKLVKHCEGIESEELYFAHRSIYEYFVAETIYNYVKDAIEIFSNESEKTFIKNIASCLKTGQLNNTIGELLKRKILKLYCKMDSDKKEIFWEWWEELVGKMMKQGMLYHVEDNIRRFDYVAIHEAICFSNIMYILSQISEIYPQGAYILSTVKNGLLQIYVKLYSIIDKFSLIHGINGKRLHPLTIRRTVFTGKNYCDLYLTGCNFCESDFTDQDLKKSDLSNGNLDNAIMINANLQEAKLEGVSMKGTDLRGADLRGADLGYATIERIKLEGAMIEDSVWAAEDILEIRPLLKKAFFDYIRLQHTGEGQEVIYREKLFSL